MKGNTKKKAPATDWTHVDPEGQARMVDVGLKKNDPA